MFLKDTLNNIIEKINTIIKSIQNLEKIIGLLNNTDKETLTYRINFLLDNLYEYKLIIEDKVKVSDKVCKLEYIPIDKNMYIKLYYRESEDNKAIEYYEIEQEDFSLVDNEIHFDSDEYNDLYAKVIYNTKSKIELN